MKQAIVTIEGVSPLSQGRFHDAPKLDKEIPKDYEQRTWRERLHVNEDNKVFISPMTFKNCLSEAAKFLSIQIPGKGKATYTKHFEAGIMVTDPMVLPINKDEVEGMWLFVPADGRRGGSKRVMKCFPVIREWGGEVTFYILDETITKDVFIQHMEGAGKFIGIGSLRVRNNGMFGRFEVKSVKWE